MTIEQCAAQGRGISAITPARLENLARAVMRTVDIPGDMAELGVYLGGSARVIASACPEKRLHLFDTFEGLPETEAAERDPHGHLGKGLFAGNAVAVCATMRGAKYELHPGLFPETVDRMEGRFSFVHVDCDLYSSARAAIDWFWPRMSPGGIMFFDDYGCDFTGVTDAVEETFGPEQIVKQYGDGVQIGCLVVKPLGGGE
jgi:O-methyltransferase